VPPTVTRPPHPHGLARVLCAGIFNADPKAANLGIVAVELAGCAVMLWPGLVTPAGWNLK